MTCLHAYWFKSLRREIADIVRERTAWFILHEVGYQNDTVLSEIEGYRTGSSIVASLACAIIVACMGFDSYIHQLAIVLMLMSISLCIIIINQSGKTLLGISFINHKVRFNNLQSAIDIVIESRLGSLEYNIMKHSRMNKLWNVEIILFGLGMSLFTLGVIQ